MQNRINQIIYLILVLGALYSCTDIIDPDISSKRIVLLSPGDGLRTSQSTHNFWWEEMEFAESYNLQIAKPNFVTIQQIVLDTMITDNHFVYGLDDGEYEWRVKAINTRSESSYETFSLMIDPTLDISDEILQLHSPSENDTTNADVLTFKWIKLHNADQYSLELFYDGSSVKLRSTENDTAIIPINWGDGDYKWFVRAENITSRTGWFERNFYIDTEAPEKPQMIQPNENEVLQDEWNEFSWVNDNEEISSITDSLVIIKVNGTNEIVRSLLINTQTHLDSLGPGNYLWYIRSVDKAGNLSQRADQRSFTIQ